MFKFVSLVRPSPRHDFLRGKTITENVYPRTKHVLPGKVQGETPGRRKYPYFDSNVGSPAAAGGGGLGKGGGRDRWRRSHNPIRFAEMGWKLNNFGVTKRLVVFSLACLVELSRTA